MYIKRHYGFWITLGWSKMPFILGAVYSLLILGIADFFEINMAFPWQPVSVIGIAVAFYLGFKNNSSYDRTWEARKIWGSIVNNSRSFAAATIAFVQGENALEIKKEMIFRHLAWLTALRHQLRLSREWEHTDERLNNRYSPTICEDYNTKLFSELSEFLSADELAYLQTKSNVATQLMRMQAERLQALKDQDYIEDFRHMELHQLMVSFYEDQGKSERIKNFPFPRQYASTALWLTMVFAVFVPFGMMDVFHAHDAWLHYLSPLISGLVIWIFFLMEKIGDYSENPFEGTYNDVPITSIARGIEIDLKEMLDLESIPKPIQAEKGFLM
ncbi:bestrophin family protein [Croceimicrobium sp.]|uniref:bestrophin family protein n=1 Tax=Croceimicrobium sp. TaxID=2828340 RepID=UPI003BAD29AC